ncbi:MFS family multidrug efflux protein [Algibacter lectus]|uniref:MFS family multidrug efflux protein n=1 Tax=Algibacter lectus TaxID=221126 RepID=A0A090X123_9FLAO|nr:MFS family multidrug efflux protein [Algibacter lectus]
MEKIKKVKFEFVALMASLMSIVALTIDALLPALPEIGASLGATSSSQNQLLITMIFLGIGFGNLFLDLFQIVLVVNPLFTLGLLFLLLPVLFV